MFRSTRQVAAILGVKPSRIGKAIWEGRLSNPQRGPSGAFLWTDVDIERACWALLHRSLDNVLEEQAEPGAS